MAQSLERAFPCVFYACKVVRQIAEGFLYELLALRRYDSLEGVIQTLQLTHSNRGFLLGSLVKTIFLLDFGDSAPLIPPT